MRGERGFGVNYWCWDTRRETAADLYFKPALESLDGRDLPNATLVAAPEANAPAETAVIPETLESMIRRRGETVALRTAAEQLAEDIAECRRLIEQYRAEASTLGAELFREANKPNPDPARIQELQDLIRWAEQCEAAATENRQKAQSDLASNLRRQLELDKQIDTLNNLILIRQAAGGTASTFNGTGATAV